MKEKTINGIFGVVMLVGAVLMIGTVGASDCNLIGIKEMIEQGTIGVVLNLIGFAGLKKRGIV